MKLAYVDLCGFRGYRKPLHIDFADGFTIIDGRNGVGKSTIFDAVEFALTGTLAKYGEAKADAETVADYIWWRGEGSPPADRYVEVGFCDGERVLPVRRVQLSETDPDELNAVLERLYDAENMPKSPLRQLCAASIIRDEHIAALSLDLKETERYALLCDAIGATDADLWIDRGSRLLALVKKRVQAAERDVAEAAAAVSAAGIRIDEIRAEIAEEVVVAAAARRLQTFVGKTVAPDQLAGPARLAIAEKTRELDQLASLRSAWDGADVARKALPTLRSAVSAARSVKAQIDTALAAVVAGAQPAANSHALARQARDLDALVSLGRKLGLHDGHCPLCASDRTDVEFANGLAIAETYAKQLDRQAVEQAERERNRKATEDAAAAAQADLERCERALNTALATIGEFEQRLAAAGFALDADANDLEERRHALRSGLDHAREDLRIVETLKLSAGLEKASRSEVEAKEAHSRALEKLGLARRAESRAQALHDGARRAAGETLDRRLDRVLPLMTELYRRLRPHPVWQDIEYKIRGDVRRFLKLEVGDELNPQFMFSSGQRRATGLAFLLAVNLSLAWSRWQTILLDDPVQHVDDFRSVQLAEVMAQLSLAGKQIICAVEDAALADLLCRRLPIERNRLGKRLTLGSDSEGALAKVEERDLEPLVRKTLVTDSQRLAG
jgi:DNA repair exonuclease SbcCD ATPase subunit